jgi:hypothetical protein
MRFSYLQEFLAYSRGWCCSRKYIPQHTHVPARMAKKTITGKMLNVAIAENTNTIAMAKQITATPLLNDRIYGM